MTRFVAAARFLFALIYIAANAPSARAQELASTATSAQVRISYETPSDEKFRPIYDALKHRQVLERQQRFLVPLRLPKGSSLCRAAPRQSIMNRAVRLSFVTS